MKKLFLAALACFAFTAASAADFVTNATGTVVYGAHSALAIKQDTSSGNRTMVLYSSGWQYVNDDAVWSKYAKLVASMGARGVAVDNDSTKAVYSIADSNGVYCQGGQSLVAYPNYGQMLAIADGCNYWAKVKALGQ